MRILPQQLPLHLKKSKAPFYLLYGPESFLLDESAKLIRQQCGESIKDAFINTGSDLDALKAYLDQPSLFASTLLIDCKIAKFSDAILQKIVPLLQGNYFNTTFLFQTPQLGRQQQSLFPLLEQKGVVVVPHFRDLAQFGTWIENRAKQLGVCLSPSLRQALLAKTEGNYSAAAQELERLRLFANSDLMEQSQYEVYDLCEAVLAKKAERVIKILSCLTEKGEAPQLVIWALTQTVDILYRCASGFSDINKILRQAGIRSHLHALYHQALKAPLPFSCSDLLGCLSAADIQVKSGNLTSAWHHILNVCLHMVGIQVYSKTKEG